MAAWLFLALSFASFAPEAAPTLTLVWHDSTRQFHAAGLARLAAEMEALFRENGLSVTFYAAAENEDLRTIPEPRVNAIVSPAEDRRFGLPPNVMAAAFGEKGEKHSIFVFLPSVRRTLGHRESAASPRHLAELSRALARIVAHEVVHVLAPDSGHAESGLMSGKLTRAELLAEAIVLDGPSRERASAAIAEKNGGPTAPAGTPELPVPAGLFRSIVRAEVPPACPCAK